MTTMNDITKLPVHFPDLNQAMQNAAMEQERTRIFFEKAKFEGWQWDNGFFWLYYNTRSGRPRKTSLAGEYGNDPRKGKPWVLRKFISRQCWDFKVPKPGNYSDFFAAEVKAAPNPTLGIVQMYTVYEENPPWKNQKTSIQSVRGYLKLDGVLMWR